MHLKLAEEEEASLEERKETVQQASLTRGTDTYASGRSLRKHRPAYQVVPLPLRLPSKLKEAVAQRKPGVDTGLANKTVADTAAIPQPRNLYPYTSNPNPLQI